MIIMRDAFVNEKVGAFAYFYQTFFSMETFPESRKKSG